MKTDSLNSFNVGGKHSQNPLGGIPMGQGQNNKMNTVEEGETKKGDFVYSDRIKLNKEMTKLLNLPPSYEGKSIADASKYVDSKFKDRTDKISTSTKTGMLDKIAQVQEAEKQRQMAEIQAAIQTNSTEVPDMMNGQVPEGMDQNQMFLGGATGSGMSMLQGAGAAGNAIGEGSFAERYDYDPKLKENYQQLEKAKDGISSAIPVFGGFFRGVEKAGKGIGTAIGGETGGDVASGILDPFSGQMETLKNKDSTQFEKGLSLAAPFLSGVIASKGRARSQARINKNNSIIESNTFNNDFALGGPINPQPVTAYDDGSVPLIDGYNNPQDWYSNNSPYMSNDRMNYGPTNNTNILPKANLKPAVDWAKNNYGNIMRYAPVATNALQLSKLKKPEQETLNRLDSRFRPEYVDERTLQNNISNEYNSVINGLSNSTNGSIGSLRSNILGAGLNKTKAVSDAYTNASAQNRAMNMQGQQFNLGIDQANLGQDNLEKDINARNRASYDNNKSKLQSALGENIGAIGKEEVYKKMAKDLFGYGWDGKYYIDKNGLKRTPSQVEKEIDQAQENQTPVNQNKLGGYLLNKKK